MSKKFGRESWKPLLYLNNFSSILRWVFHNLHLPPTQGFDSGLCTSFFGDCPRPRWVKNLFQHHNWHTQKWQQQISRGKKIYMGVSKNNGTPKSSILIGFSIIFTIHFGAPLIFILLATCITSKSYLKRPPFAWDLHGNMDDLVVPLFSETPTSDTSVRKTD